MEHIPDWARQTVAAYLKIAEPNYHAAIWPEARRALSAVTCDDKDVAAAWRTLTKRLAKHSDAGREHFVMQVCFLVASSQAAPTVPPAKAKRTAEKARRAVTQLLTILPDILPFAREVQNTAEMRLASAQAVIRGDKYAFTRELFRAMLAALPTDINTWQQWNSRLAKPDNAHASRLLLVQDLTQLFHAYFGTPLRAVVAAMANAVYPDTRGLDAATVSKLAPLNEKKRIVTSLHALQ